MSLRISTQLSPCLTPSLCNPPAIQAARSATSAWSRRRSPEMMPRKGNGDIVAFYSSIGAGLFDKVSRLDIDKLRRALLDVGADCFRLVRAADQLLLLG